MTAPVSLEQRVLQLFEPWPEEELVAAMTTQCKKHVSFYEILSACRKADTLTVLEVGNTTIVGIEVSDHMAHAAMSVNGESSGNCFRINGRMYDYAAIPKEGCDIAYVGDWDSDNSVVALPRLTTLERGRQNDYSGLLFCIVDAIGLVRVKYNPETETISYY